MFWFFCISICSGWKHPRREEKNAIAYSLYEWCQFIVGIDKLEKLQAKVMNDVITVSGFVSGQSLSVTERAVKCYHCIVATYMVHKRFSFLYTSILSLLKTHHRQVNYFEASACAFSVLPQQFDFSWFVSRFSGWLREQITQIYLHLNGNGVPLGFPVSLFYELPIFMEFIDFNCKEEIKSLFKKCKILIV